METQGSFVRRLRYVAGPDINKALQTLGQLDVNSVEHSQALSALGARYGLRALASTEAAAYGHNHKSTVESCVAAWTPWLPHSDPVYKIKYPPLKYTIIDP